MQLQYSTQMKMLQKKHLNAKAWEIIRRIPIIEFISVKLQALNVQTAILPLTDSPNIRLTDLLHLAIYNLKNSYHK